MLSIGATDEIDLTATAVDLNGTLNVSGVATFQATPVFPDCSLPLADLDIDGGTDIGAAIVDADLFIIDDGAGGTNRKVTASRLKTYVGMTPLFYAYKAGNTSVATATWTKMDVNTERFDDDGTYDHATNYRWTPGVSGKYFLHAKWRSDGWAATRNMISIYKNGSVITNSTVDIEGEDSSSIQTVQTSIMIDSDTNDYFEAFAWHNQGGDSNIYLTHFMGWRLE